MFRAMHTVLVIVGGVILLGAFLLLGKVTSGMLSAWALAFIPVWLLAAFGNMWFGVKRAGYTWADEFPIFLVVFAVPALIAALAWWKFSRH
jgi:uncharacterized membrane protein YwaF